MTTTRKYKPKPRPLNWSEFEFDNRWAAELEHYRLLVVPAGKRWAWSVTLPGELVTASPDGLTTRYSRGAAMRAAERAARRRLHELRNPPRPPGRPRREARAAL